MTSTVYPDTPRARGNTDAPHVSGVTPAEDARTILINKISWGAVLAGVAVSLVAQLVSQYDRHRDRRFDARPHDRR